MDFFETPEEVAGQLENARAKLKDFEDISDADLLMARLRNSAPFHPALIARWVFLGLASLGIVASLGVASLPFVLGPEQVPDALARIDRSMGLPLPVVFGIFALCLGVAYLGATQAALQIARDCALLPNEQREHERLLNEVKRLSSQKAIMDRVRGTPMGARPRSMTPGGSGPRAATPLGPPSRMGSSNSMPSYGAPTRAGAQNSLPSYIAQPARPGTVNSGGGAAPAMAPPTRAGAMNSMPSYLATPVAAPSAPPITMPTTSTLQKGTPLGAMPRAGTPIGKLGGQRPQPQSLPPDRIKTLSDDEDPSPGPPADPFEVPEISEADTSDFFAPAAPLTAVPTALRKEEAPLAGGMGFEQKYATHFPQWGQVDEPWLEDAIQKAEILATGFPVQARLQFSPEQELPFALVLERATPAMAVRAMVSYVEFLASMPTPKRARIVLRSVPHLDRSFHRNVEAALEPYFPDKAGVSREADHIEIAFTEPDPCWNDVPFLPIQQT